MVFFSGQINLQPRPYWSHLEVSFQMSDEYLRTFQMRVSHPATSPNRTQTVDPHYLKTHKDLILAAEE